VPRVIRRPRPPIADNVHVDSLKKTVEAHYDANRASLIRKQYAYDRYRESTTLRPSFLTSRNESTSKDVPQRTRTRKEGFNRSGKSQGPLKPLKEQSALARKAGRGNYVGISQELYSEWMPQEKYGDTYAYPWMDFIHQTGGDALERLNTEIRAFQDFMTPTLFESQASNTVVKDLKLRFEELFPNHRTELVGSRATGLALPRSDIDLQISPKSTTTFRPNHRRFLKEVFEAVSHDKDGSHGLVDIELVKATTPIIRAVHCATDLKVQLQIADDGLVSKKYVQNYIAEFPNLQPLYTLIRSMLEIRGLTGVFGGGVGSYTIVMMVVASLKHSHASSSTDDLSKQLFYFFDMFLDTNFSKTCISVDPPTVYYKHTNLTRKEGKAGRKVADGVKQGQFMISKTNKEQPYLMCLQDPADPMNDLGKRSHGIKDIQATLCTLLNKLEGEMEAWERNGPSQEHAILGPLVGAKYDAFLHGRQKVHNFGRGVAGDVEGADAIHIRRVKYG
jgi:DNA polymerase sigma